MAPGDVPEPVMIELECGHPLQVLPLGWIRPEAGPCTYAPLGAEMICRICQRWEKVIGRLPRVVPTLTGEDLAGKD